MKLRTNKAAAEYSGLPVTLINATIRQLGEKDRIQNVFLHGPKAGYSGFTYYRETEAFYRRHRGAINERVIAVAEECDEDPVQMVLGMVSGPAPKPPMRPLEPKAPLLPYDVPSETPIPPNIGLEEAVERAQQAKEAYKEADCNLSDLIEEWCGAPKVLSHDSITYPDMELREAERAREQAFITYRKAYVVSARVVHQEQMRRYAEAQEEYKKALRLYEGLYEDYKITMTDRATDKKLIAQCIYGSRLTDAHTQIANALAWFALEEVARAVVIDE